MTRRSPFPRAIASVALFAIACADVPTELAPDSEPQLEPQSSLSSAGHESVYGLASSGSNIFAVGMTTGELDGRARGGEDAFLRQYDVEGDLKWAVQFGSTAHDRAYDVAVGLAGYQIIVAGSTNGSIGGNRGAWDGFVRVYMTGGTVQWTRQFGSGGDDEAKAVAADVNGNVYVAGFTNGRLGLERQGQADAFVRKYSSEGAVLWTRQFGTRRYDAVTDIDVDGEGNVYVVGNSTGNFVVQNRGLTDVFIQKLTPDGDPIWTRTFGTAFLDEASGITVNGTHVAVVGATMGDMRGGNAGGRDAFVRVYDRDGTYSWTRQFGSTETDRAMAVDAYPDIIAVAGSTEGDLTAAVTTTPDGFLALYGLDGRRLSLVAFDTGESDHVNALTLTTGGAIVMGGDTDGDFVEGSLGGLDGFVWYNDGNDFWIDQ